MPVEANKPKSLSNVYDQYAFPYTVIRYGLGTGKIEMDITAQYCRETGDNVTTTAEDENGDPKTVDVMDPLAPGTPLKVREVMPGTPNINYVEPDMAALAAEKMAAGDPRYAQMLSLMLTLAEERGRELGLLD